MIFEAIVNLFVGLVSMIFDGLGTKPAPGWLTNVAANLSEVVGFGASMGSWVPWSILGSCAAAVVSCAALSLVVRVVRILVSLFTGGGGSAA